MVVQLPWVATILPWRRKFSRGFGRSSALPISFAVMFYHKPKILLPG